MHWKTTTKYIDNYLKRPTITCIKRCFYCLFLFLSSAKWSKHWYKSECTNVHFDHFLFTDIIFFGFLCPRKKYFILLSDLLLGFKNMIWKKKILMPWISYLFSFWNHHLNNCKNCIYYMHKCFDMAPKQIDSYLTQSQNAHKHCVEIGVFDWH